MMSRPSNNIRHRSRRGSSRGFSFTEVLFAVMILGVGFIMVAAIFPVAIQQQRTTSEEGNAAAIARGAVKFIEENLTGVDMPAMGMPGIPAPVLSFRDPQVPTRGVQGVQPILLSSRARLPVTDLNRWQEPYQLWNKVRGNLIVPNDPRYAWVPLYRRDVLPGPTPAGVPAPYAQVIIVVAQVRDEITAPAASRRSGTGYTASDVNTANTAPGALVNLQARPVGVTIPINSQQISFVPGTNSGAAATGAYVIIAQDPNNGGRMNGRIYRIGNQIDPDTWELMPGNDFVPDPGPDGRLGTGDDVRQIGPRPAAAFVVGKTLTDGSGSTPVFGGIAQDISVYTTFIQMR